MGAAQPSVRIAPASVDHLRALIDGPAAYRERFGIEVIDGYLEFDGVLQHAVDQLEDGADPSWWTHLFYDDSVPALIGLGGFKGPPVEGTAEVGYGIAPTYRGQGWATAAARELIDELRRRGVATAMAHTLAEPNPSNKLLRNLGFVRTAEIVDEEAPGGVVWRWELRLT